MTGLRISLFGPFRTVNDVDEPVAIRARKNRALLAILACLPGTPRTRGRLAGLLWGNRADEQARASLRQALSTLRQDLGPHAAALEVDGEQIRLVPERVVVDIATLRRRLDHSARDDWLEAARLVRGPFLDGLELDEPGFLDWREHARQNAHAVAISLLRRCARERFVDHPDAAIHCLRRCLELEPYHEAVHRELMRAYDIAGRTAEALEHFEALTRTLETELSTRPANETARLAERLRAPPNVAGPADAATTPAPKRREVTSTPTIPGDQATSRHAIILTGRLDLQAGTASDEPVEAAHATTMERLAGIKAIVEAHDARFLHHGGARFLAVFGLEHARGSEPERAIRTAIDLRDWQADHRRGPQPAEGLRCVITCGRVRIDAGAESLRLRGAAIERAERIESLAPAGAVLIDETLRCLLQDHVRLEIGAAASPDDEPVWQLHALHSGAPPTGTRPLVGRRYELAEIERALEGTLREQCAHVVLVRGEAGVGKTRLLQEVGTRARERDFELHAATVLDFGVAEGEDTISNLLRSLLGSALVQRKSDADALVEEGILAAEQVPFLLDLLDVPQPPGMRALYAAMDNEKRRQGQLDVLVHLATRRCRVNPLLISVEDIHWADDRTLRMLGELVRNIVDRRIVLVMTSRIEGDPINRAWLASRRTVPMLTLDIAPLRHCEARELAGHFDVPWDAHVENCVVRAEGNPLFLIQLLLDVRAPDGDSVPSSIHSLVQARLDALDPDLRGALQAASIVGPHFSLDEIDALLGEQPDAERLLDSGLVESHGEGLAFSHALLRDAIRESLTHDRRRALHARAAEWFCERDPVLHARHLESAEDERAPLAYLEAASQQAHAFRYDRAAELLEHGLVLARTPAERSRLLMRKGEVMTEAGRTHEAITVLRAARNSACDPAIRCRILVDIASAMRVTDQIDEAFVNLDEAEPIARRENLTTELARLSFLRGSLHFPRGRMVECLQWQQQACRYAQEAGSPELEAMTLGGLADAYYAQGCFLQARDIYERCVRIAEENGLGRIAVANRIQIGSLKKYALELEAGIAHARRSIEIAREVGHKRAELLAHHSMAFLLMETGAADEMLQHVECADTLIACLRSKRFMPRSLYYRAKAHQLRGERRRARKLLLRAYDACHDGNAAFVGPSIYAALALATTDQRERGQLLEEARRVLDSGALVHNRIEYHRDCIELALNEMATRAIHEHADALESAMKHEPTPYTDHLVQRARLLARWHQGERDTTISDALKELAETLSGRSYTELSRRITDTIA